MEEKCGIWSLGVQVLAGRTELAVTGEVELEAEGLPGS